MTQTTGGTGAAASESVIAAATERVGRYRWVILAFIFFATTLNYVDRFTMSFLRPTLSAEFHWSQLGYSYVVFAFSAAYALGYFIFGRVIDKLGAKTGYTVAVVIWTCAHLACALVTSVTGFIFTQFALGLGQSGNFPAALKSVTEWFPQRERAFATGVFNAGTNIGAILTPIIVPVIVLTFNWQTAFVITGSLSAIWLVMWLKIYREPRDHPKVTPAELAYIESDKQPPIKSLPWLKLFPIKETWAFAIGKFMTDPIWWFYLFWLPSFFHDKYGLNLTNFGPPIIAIYVLSDIGSIAGGWMSSTMIKHGASVNLARKLTMLISAVCVLPVVSCMYISNEWIAVGVIGLATAAHQAFSANLFTIPSDTMPKAAVASVVGIGGTAGGIGGMLIAGVAGLVLQYTGTYTPLFIIAGTIYLAALLIIHLLSPRLAPANIS
ncbi:MAG: MFS transporter [Alphaproteobacteria bacterium]|nr:MFS transporter [Alphaproteobacteria bacterium]MDE2112256.1 MFS transporter [Alphaproteobacteria bacterium]MDE2495514.1 MFS transporter [Alphaproteobacteria bacterium]